MKKLNLKNAKDLLSRKEMKAITGGYASPGWCGASSWTCLRLGLYARYENPNICCTIGGATGSW